MSETFVDLYGDELSKLLSSSDTTGLFTTAKRKLEINNAVEWFVVQTECVIRKVSLTLSDNTSQVNLRSAITAADYLRLAKRGPEIRMTRTADGALTVIAGRDFQRTTIETMNRDVSNWQATTKSTPTNWYLEPDGGELYLGIFPPLSLPTGYTAVVVVPYVARPVDMAGDSDVPFTVASGNADLTLTPWYDGITFKAASELEQLRKDTNQSKYFGQLALGRVMDYLDKQRAPGGRRVQVPSYRTSSRWQSPRAVRETVTS